MNGNQINEPKHAEPPVCFWCSGSLPKPNLRILSSSRYNELLFFAISCSSRPPVTHKHNNECWYSQVACCLLPVQWEWDAEVHSPDVCPCRECVRMCVCCVRSIVLSIWNIRRSSSSKAMSPQKTAGKREKLSSSSSSSSAPTVSLHHLWKWSHKYIKL